MPSAVRWGVFQLRFGIEVMAREDLIRNFFHAVLPLPQREYKAFRREA